MVTIKVVLKEDNAIVYHKIMQRTLCLLQHTDAEIHSRQAETNVVFSLYTNIDIPSIKDIGRARSLPLFLLLPPTTTPPPSPLCMFTGVDYLLWAVFDTVTQKTGIKRNHCTCLA